MANVSNTLPPDYWNTFSPGKSDIEFISNYLFENESPLTEKEIVPILVEERIRGEREALLKQQQGGSNRYLPEGSYQVGNKLAFPALEWQKGKVIDLRPGINPSVGEFEVIEVEFDGGLKKKFAARLDDHKLNHPAEAPAEDETLDLAKVISVHGADLETAIAKGLRADDNLAQIAGRWFPRALLMNVNVGHLNLAEAVLDEAAGKPLTTGALIEQVALPGTENKNLVEFSMNYALQEDGRFDEVGPAGEVLWCLKRLEPADVQQIPLPLRYTEIPYERSALTKEMLALEAAIDDELGESDSPAQDVAELTISLTYPHWRAGTLPVSIRTRKLFPTAYESERVRFTLVDAISKEEIPAWVVRHHGYVAGLKNLYQKYGLIPGSLVTLRRSQKPGQVIVEARTRRPMRDWVRTVLVGSDGGIVFANLKQNLTTEFNDRMVVAVPDAAGVDAACEQLTKQRVPFEKLVANMMQELTKMNVQGHVHAQELYSALNIIRRCPAGPLLAHLSQSPAYKHVGDLHFRITEAEGADE
ncbi:MAG: hypothetical protein HY781_02955 [Chloroflexi bacterium]|nr:hypothetical protein [Chloroflexota bacterium]